MSRELDRRLRQLEQQDRASSVRPIVLDKPPEDGDDESLLPPMTEDEWRERYCGLDGPVLSADRCGNLPFRPD